MATTAPLAIPSDQTTPPAASPALSAAPVPIPAPSTSSPKQPPTSSALSASLKAFRELAIKENPDAHPFASDEFQQAYHHVRRTSFGNVGAGNPGPPPNLGLAIDGAPPPATTHTSLPALSTSPSSSSEAGTSAGSSLPTPPPASPPSAKPRSLAGPGGGNGSLKVKKPSSTLGGVCEGPEIALENGHALPGADDASRSPVALGIEIPSPDDSATVTGVSSSPRSSATAGGGLFAGGARWGWPASGGTAGGSPPIAGSPAGPMSLPAPGFAISSPSTANALTAPDELLSPTHQRRRSSISFAAAPPPPSAAAVVPSASTSAAPASTGASAVASPLATSPPTSDPFRMMQPLGRVVSAGATMQTPNSAGGNGGQGGDGFGLFRRLSIGGFNVRKTRPTAPQPASPPSGFQAGTLPAPTLLEPTHASLSPPSISTTEAKAAHAPPPAGPGAQRGRTLGPGSAGGGAGGGGTKTRKLSPMGERILRGGY
ncbi:hypothetical protein JCM8202_000994 [Rhodotorula sphaerocarpa]